MEELDFSSIVGSAEQFELQKFEAQARIHIHHHRMSWDSAWPEILQNALYSQGPDISQVGTTWLGSLAGMGALRPISEVDINQIGGRDLFLPCAWQSLKVTDSPGVWAVPLFTDTRLLVYRRDLLAGAGVNEAAAFQSSEAFVDTLTRLQQACDPCQTGAVSPFVMSTVDELVHNLAPWVWEAGGDFTLDNPDERSLTAPKTLAGLKSYFELARYIAPAAQNLGVISSDDLFLKGKAAVTYSGPWLISNAEQEHSPLAPEVMDRSNLGFAPIPGVPFIGGSCLVIWRHTLRMRAAVELARFLTQPALQADCRRFGWLPARAAALQGEPFKSDPLYRAIAESLERGRGIASNKRWMAIEARLVQLFKQLWADIFTYPDLDIERELYTRLAELNDRIAKTLLAKF